MWISTLADIYVKSKYNKSLPEVLYVSSFLAGEKGLKTDEMSLNFQGKERQRHIQHFR